MSQFGNIGLWVTLASLRAKLVEGSSEYWARPFWATKGLPVGGAAPLRSGHPAPLLIVPVCCGWRFIAPCPVLLSILVQEQWYKSKSECPHLCLIASRSQLYQQECFYSWEIVLQAVFNFFLKYFFCFLPCSDRPYISLSRVLAFIIYWCFVNSQNLNSSQDPINADSLHTHHKKGGLWKPGSLFYTLSLCFECVLCWDKVWMKEFANYEMLFHTMLLHQVKTFLFLIYHHIYRASSSVHSFSSALSLRFVWSQGGISARWLLHLVTAWET